MVVNGFKPSLGEHYCFLCWRGYNRPGVLQSHYNGPSHAEQVERQGVKAIWKKAQVEMEHKGDEFKCPACNLVFVSEQSEQNHRQSERHGAVIQRSRPQDSRGRPGRYCCFLCWHGFEVQKYRWLKRCDVVLHQVVRDTPIPWPFCALFEGIDSFCTERISRLPDTFTRAVLCVPQTTADWGLKLLPRW